MTRSATPIDKDQIESAQIVLTCNHLDATLQFFTEQLGFRVETIFPADAPAVAIIDGYGVRLRLIVGDGEDNHRLRLLSSDPALLSTASDPHVLRAPNGTHIEIVPARPPLTLPKLAPSLTLQRAADDAAWHVGRAGMRYRDLIPNRQGGRVIASHITIPEGGAVPDYVHYHKVRFQMIFCRRGWVRVVYEDQGEPFVLEAGDCVLQPPEIRHRVLESSVGLEVIEIGSPAEHETHADPERTLPTGQSLPHRDFNGQRFVRHHARDAEYRPWPHGHGYRYRDTGIGDATNGLADVHVVIPVREAKSGDESEPDGLTQHDGEMVFFFVLDGAVTLQLADRNDVTGGDDTVLSAGDAVTLPPQLRYGLRQPSADLELLAVTIHNND